MLGRGTLLLVIGFGFIMLRLSIDMTNKVSGMVLNTYGYYDISKARDAANVGAQLGLMMLSKDPSLYKGDIIKDYKPKTGSLAGTTINVKCDTIPVTADSIIIRLRSIAEYSMPLKNIFGESVKLVDTTEVRLSRTRFIRRSFTQLAWMTVNEGNIFFITGDTLWGKVHSNSNIHVSGSPVFKEKVTTSGIINPVKNDAIFENGFETRVPERAFPNDLSELWKNKVNSDTNSTLYVEFNRGTTADGDGYVIIRKGSWTGQRTDSIRIPYSPTPSSTRLVIYSNQDIRVRGTVDGRISICSKRDIYIDDDVRYERPYPPFSSITNTDDMLGLIAERNVVIADNTANNGNDLHLHANIFARTGSFMAENYNNRGVEGRIWLLGSIQQKDRGAVGNFSGNTLRNGYWKSYYYDKRLENPEWYPPFYPSFTMPPTFGYSSILNWWESYSASTSEQSKYFLMFE
ncbi:MAG: DUF4900 domain-containing protein [Bacteroidetes bacterium]|nr:DUF4900 domain-containing protein [Bacteroidota bacterium]